MQKFFYVFKKFIFIFLTNLIIFSNVYCCANTDSSSDAVEANIGTSSITSSGQSDSYEDDASHSNLTANETNSSQSDSSVIPTTYSGACILMDLDVSKVLYSKNANEKMYPASTTKVMTAILTLENCNLSDVAAVSHNAVYSIPSGYSIASLHEGEELTIEQLLNVLLIPSANDAAVVLAEHIAGSVEAFADMMNEKATEIGCTNTHFVNPNGIHNEDHYSTAHDLALIGQYAMKFDTFKQIASKTSYTLAGNDKFGRPEIVFNTTNELIKVNHSSSPSNYYYEYATAGKTGYTDAAKSCIIATAKKDGRSLLVVVLHGGSTEEGLSQRALDCKTLFEYGFNNYSYKTVAKKGDVAKSITINNGTSETKSLDLLYSDDVNVLVSNSSDVSDAVDCFLKNYMLLLLKELFLALQLLLLMAQIIL